MVNSDGVVQFHRLYMQLRVSGNTSLNNHHVSLQLLQDCVAVLCQVLDTIVQISFVSIVFVFLASTVTKLAMP